MAVFIVIGLVFAFLGGFYAAKKGRSGALWGIICFFTGIFGLLILAILGENKEKSIG